MTSGSGTAADPYITTWISGGDTVRIATGKGTVANDDDVREQHDETVTAAKTRWPED